MAISAAEIERIRQSLAAEPFTRQTVRGTTAERAASAALARSYREEEIAGRETEEPVITPTPVSPAIMTPEPVQTIGMETEDVVISNGIAANGFDEDFGTTLAVTGAPAAIPTAFPLVAGLAMLSVGALKRLLAMFGPKILKAMIGAAAFKELWDILTGKTFGTDDMMIPVKPGETRKRRYSIGGNPRVRTLQKVSRHCQRLLKKHEKVIREFLPRRPALPAKALARTYLSTAERKALTG